MGGICGCFQMAGSPERTLDSMIDAMSHRGPDGMHTEVVGTGTGLGYCHISLNGDHGKISDAMGRDPSAGVYVAADVDILNMSELCRKIDPSAKEGAISHAQLFAELYKKEGVDFVKNLRGVFAIAVLDLRKDRMYLIKDRLGVKPLFYTVLESGVLFASEIKSILASGYVEKEVDVIAIHNFLTLQYVPYPSTIYKTIKKVPPASIVEIKGRSISEERYWSLPFMPKVQLSYGECKERLRGLVEEAARLMLPAGDDFGCLISGGIDSTIITGLLTKMTGRSLPVFSIGFDIDEFNELPFAERTAERYGCDLTKLVVKPDMIDILPKLVWHYEEPYGDSSSLPTFYVMELARQSVPLAFLGDGGDDSFAGYMRYWAIKAAVKFDILPHSLMNRIISAVLAVYPKDVRSRSLLRYSRRFLDMLRMPLQDRYGSLMSVMSGDVKEKLYTGDFSEQVRDIDSIDFVRHLFRESPEEYDVLDRLLYTDLSSYMPGDLTVKVEVAAAANRLVTRAPLLDNEVVDFAASLPADYKLHGRSKKHILKDTFSDFLPEEVVKRRKTGFGAPIGYWFKKELYGYIRDNLLHSKLPGRGYFRPEAIERVVEEHRNNIADNTYILWNLLMLELWHQQFVDK